MSIDIGNIHLQVKIFSPSTVYYDGNAERLSAQNETGTFDILPLHHNFISLLGSGVITVVLEKNKQKQVEISSGLLHVKNNIVTVFLDV